MNPNGAQLLRKQLQIAKHQIDLLSQFASRLTKFYDDAFPQLDPELHILRSQIANKANFSVIEDSISQITGTLLKDVDSFKKQNLSAIGLLETATNELLTRDFVSAEIKTSAETLFADVRRDNFALFSSLPVFEQLVFLFLRALDNTHTSDASPNEIQPISAELHTKITQELRELVDQLAGNAPKNRELLEVKQLLVHEIEHQALLECCLVLLRTLTQDVTKERKQAEKFANGLHQSLVRVNDTVDKSINGAADIYANKQQATDTIKDHLQDMESVIEETNDIQLLKDKANDYLNKISSSLNDLEQCEQQEQEALMTLLQEMKDQLTSLENEATEYKHRLLEQKYSSHHDSLTQIPNRMAYNERIEMEYRRWKRYKSNLCLALIDVDHFKKINDTYGHASGDKTLQVLAQNINRCLRSTDFLARWGGEEFILLLPNTAVEELDSQLERIRNQIERIPFKFKAQKVNITISIGAANFKAGDSIESVFERADQGLYEAKNSGRNRCIIKQG